MIAPPALHVGPREISLDSSSSRGFLLTMEVIMSEEKALAVRHAQEIVKKYESENALVFVRPGDIDTQAMFVPEITVLHAMPDDFHSRQITGRLMPKSHYVDRMSLAAGISFVPEQCGTRKEGPDTWVGRAQGTVRLPDGSWRTSSVQEYEFDVEVRSQEDFTKDTRGTYNSDVKKKVHVLELRKFARARASTGARLRVIRELTGTPTAFLPDQMQRAMVFSRVSVNSDLLLSDPATANAAVYHALGVKEKLYGPTERDVTPAQDALPAPGDESGEAEVIEQDTGFLDDPPTPEQVYIDRLKAYLDPKWKLPTDATDQINGLLAFENPTLEDLQEIDARCTKWLKAHDVEPMADIGVEA